MRGFEDPDAPLTGGIKTTPAVRALARKLNVDLTMVTPTGSDGLITGNDVQRAGSLTIQLPQSNEVLQSVRFDGTRAYAITSEQRDPLFTFDLSDPEHPQQRGQLELPGWVYHMEPRGNRMYALGYDQQNPAGSLNVSLFDVSNLDQPQLIQRVNFGGDWGMATGESGWGK